MAHTGAKEMAQQRGHALLLNTGVQPQHWFQLVRISTSTPGHLVPSASPCTLVHIHIQEHACILNFLMTQVDVAVCQVHMKSSPTRFPCSRLLGKTLGALTPSTQKRIGL